MYLPVKYWSLDKTEQQKEQSLGCNKGDMKED